MFSLYLEKLRLLKTNVLVTRSQKNPLGITLSNEPRAEELPAITWRRKENQLLQHVATTNMSIRAVQEVYQSV